jgi:hypothetical protein
LSRGPTERGSYRVIFRNESSDRYLVTMDDASGSVGAVEKSETIGDLEWEVVPVELANEGLKLPPVPLPVSDQPDVSLPPATVDPSPVQPQTEEVPEVLATAQQCLADGLITQEEFQQLVGHHMSFLEAAETEKKAVDQVVTVVPPEKDSPTLLMRSTKLSESEDTTPRKFMTIALKKFDSEFPKWELAVDSHQTLHAAIGPKLDALLSGSPTQILEVLGDETSETREKKQALKESFDAMLKLTSCGKAHKKFKTAKAVHDTGLYSKLLAAIASPTPSDVMLRITVPGISLTRDYALGGGGEEPIRSLTELEAIQTELSHRGSRLKAQFMTGGSKILSMEVVKSPQSIKFLSDRMATVTKHHIDAMAQFVTENNEEDE